MIDDRLQEFREELRRLSQLSPEGKTELQRRMAQLSWQELSVLRQEFDWPKKPKPVYFKSLGLENVHCFGGRQELDLTADGIRPARWTLILGDNGVGKTTLLQCLAWMRLMPPREKPALLREENETIERLLRVGTEALVLDTKLTSGSTLASVGENPKSAAERVLDFNMSLRVFFDDARRLDKKPETTQTSKTGFVEPLVVVYGANRRHGVQNLGKDDLRDALASSRLSEHTELYDVEQFLSNLHYASLVSDDSSPEQAKFERMKSVLARILGGDFKADDIQVFPPDDLDSRARSGVYLKTFTGLVPMSELSLGYQTTLAWIGDFALRLMKHYDESEDPLAEPAVMFIDEIDLHLHPLWQLGIIEDLSEILPGTQFIATSHSPLMAQVAETANFVLLRQRETDVEIVNDPEVVRSWRVDQILTSELFGVYRARDKQTELLFRRRDELLDKPSRSGAEEAELEELRAQIFGLRTAQYPNDHEAMEFIREAAALLKKNALGEE